MAPLVSGSPVVITAYGRLGVLPEDVRNGRGPNSVVCDRRYGYVLGDNRTPIEKAFLVGKGSLSFVGLSLYLYRRAEATGRRARKCLKSRRAMREFVDGRVETIMTGLRSRISSLRTRSVESHPVSSLPFTKA